MLLEQVLAQWWHPVASREALDLLHWAMCTVLYRRIAMAIKTATKWVYCLIVVLLIVALAATGVIWSE